MKLRTFNMAVALSTLLLTAGAARASFLFATDSATYTVPAGGTIDIPVYLRETEASSPFTLDAEQGLAEAQFIAQWTSLSGTPPVAVENITANPAFANPVAPTITSTSGSLEEIYDPFNDTHGVLPDPLRSTATTRDVFLGTLTFSATGTAGSSATYALTTTSSLGPTVTFASEQTATPTDLNPLIAPANITIDVAAAVPEPATAATLLAGTVFLLRRRRA